MTAENVYQCTVGFFEKKVTVDELEKMYHAYMENGKEERMRNASLLIRMFSPLIQSCKNSHSRLYYFFLSFLIYATGDTELCNELLRSSIEDAGLSKEMKYGIYSYAAELSFLRVIQSNAETSELSDRLYQEVYEAFREETLDGYHFLPREERNQELIFVLTSQILGMGHGPTKTLLDRCEILKTVMKKEVFIINTAEMKGDMTGLPLFNSSVGNYRDEYNDRDYLLYHNREYPFFQCPRGMPNVPVIREILAVVASERPLCIVTIGGGSIVSDLCSSIVPTIVISTVFSNRAQTYGQFQAVGRKLTENDYMWGSRHHLPKEHFIESVFTFSLKEQEHSYTRADLLLPEQGFIAALVGERLDKEIDEECLEMLEKLMEGGVYIAFIGKFDRLEKLKKQNPLFAAYGISMGRQEDVLAVLDCVDVYINPRRVGGGTSIVEALYKGVPAVTLDYGDAAKSAGQNFVVEDFSVMYDVILKYRDDPDFYSEMAGKAKKRAEEVMDSKKEFVRIMDTAMSREGFDSVIRALSV